MASHTPSFKETPPSQIVHEIASPLIAVRNGEEEFVSGTAVVIGRGYALTAYHVLADFIERYEGVRDVESHLNISFEILMLLSLNAARDNLPIKVMRIWRRAPLDLAVLALGVPDSWPDDYVWRVPRLSLLPPKVGEQISAFGFADSVVSRQGDVASPLVNLHPRTSVGTVAEIHHLARDISRMPFPCFRTSARFDAGMSGGPIFDRRGMLCGLICSSLPPTDADDEHVSYGCTLWPVVGTMIDAGESGVGTGDNFPLFDLVKKDVVSAIDSESIYLPSGLGGAQMPVAQYSTSLWDAGVG